MHVPDSLSKGTQFWGILAHVRWGRSSIWDFVRCRKVKQVHLSMMGKICSMPVDQQ